MKKILIGIYKVLFWAYFMYCTGIVQGIVSLEKNSKQLPGYVEDKSEGIEDRHQRSVKMYQFYNERVLAAQAKVAHGNWYSPYDYFSDMRDVNNYRKEHGVQEIPLYTELQVLMEKSVRGDGPYTYDDIAKARDIADPGSYTREKTPVNWHHIFATIGSWALMLYLKMLPFVLFLFLIWIYEKNDRKKLTLKNPLSFFISLLFHPIVIFLAIRQWWEIKGREFVASVETRRVKEKAFSLFSEDELALIRQFGKRHITYREFKLKLHGKRTLLPQRSFIIAMIATLIMCCAPRIQTGASTDGRDLRKEIYQVTNCYDYFSASLPLEIPTEWGYLWQQHTAETDFPPPLCKAVERLYGCITSYLLPRGYIQAIEHVPLVVNSFFMKMKMFVNQKNKKYEIASSTYSAFPYRNKFCHCTN